MKKIHGRTKLKSIKLNKTYDLQKAQIIGEGNFATVYKIYDQQMQKFVAIRKVLINKQDYNDIMQQKQISFQLKRITSSYILNIYDIIEQDNQILYFTQYCEGGSLWDAISQRIGNKFSQLESTQIMMKIVAGVQILHQNGITHRDLKPQNILLQKKIKKGHIPNIKLADFGLSTHNKIMQTIAGTKQYLAPQQAKFFKYNNKVDIWAIGIIYDQLLHGSPYFTGQSNKEVFEKIATDQFRTRDNRILDDISNLLFKMLKKDPKQRPQIKEVKSQIHIILKKLSETPRLYLKTQKKQDNKFLILTNQLPNIIYNPQNFCQLHQMPLTIMNLKKQKLQCAYCLDNRLHSIQNCIQLIKEEVRKLEDLKKFQRKKEHFQTKIIGFQFPLEGWLNAFKNMKDKLGWVNYSTAGKQIIQGKQKLQKSFQQLQNHYIVNINLIKSNFYEQLNQQIEEYIQDTLF